MKHLHKTICIILLAFIVVFSNCIIVSAESSEGVNVTITISTNDKNFKKGEEVVFEVNLTEQTGLDEIGVFGAKIVFNSNQLKLKDLRSSEFIFTTETLPTQDTDYAYGAASFNFPSTMETVTINEIVFEALQDHKDMGSVAVGLKLAVVGNTDKHKDVAGIIRPIIKVILAYFKTTGFYISMYRTY